jgi:putative PEP-CTERM system TPR-repeat lipoprotein
VLTIDDMNAFAHNLLGSTYLALGKAALAMEEFDRAIELDPGLIEAHIKKGAFNLLSGNAKTAEEEFVNAVEIAPNLLNSRIILAQYYIKSRRFNEAVNVLENGLKKNPDDAILYNIIGIANLGAKETAKALKSFENAKNADPEFIMPYFNTANYYLEAGDKGKATEEYKKVLELDKDNVNALLMIAKVMEEDGYDKKALSFYTRAKEQRKSAAYLSLAGYYLRKGKGNEALIVLDEALDSDQGDVSALDMKGRIYVAGKKYNDALLNYKKMKEVSPRTGAFRLAGVHMIKKDYDDAIRELEMLMDLLGEKQGGLSKLSVNKKIDTSKIDVLLLMTEIYIKKNEYGNAEISAKEIISLVPDSDAGYKVLADVYVANNQFANAVTALEKAEQLSPDDLSIKLAKGRVYMSANDLNKAMIILRAIEKSNPEYVQAHLLQANIFEITDRNKDAVRKHKKVLALSPDNILSLNNLAYLYAEGYGPVDKAISLAQRAKKLTPNNGNVSDTLGWAYYQSGNYDEALKNFIEATKYIPDEPSIHYHIGLAFLKKEMKDKAEEQFKKAIALAGNNEFAELKEARRLMRGLKH